MLDAIAIKQIYSRLVVDCNRPPGHPGLIAEVSDGTTIPANLRLRPQQIEQRLSEIHRPYHNQIASILQEKAATGRAHVLLMIHSFTPRMKGMDRPWRFGVLHLNNSPYSDTVLAHLREADTDGVGDNEPYAMDGADYSAPRHSRESGFDYLELEVRQDLIASPQQIEDIAAWLTPILQQSLLRTKPS